eukprot:10096840-Alexandrium_andersonii.AAC.1
MYIASHAPYLPWPSVVQSIALTGCGNHRNRKSTDLSLINRRLGLESERLARLPKTLLAPLARTLAFIPFRIGSGAAGAMPSSDASEASGAAAPSGSSPAAQDGAVGSMSTQGRLPQVRLPVYSGERKSRAYQEWKHEVQTIRFAYGLEEAQLAPLMLLSLASGPGKPRDLVRHLDLEKQIC